MTKLYLSVLAVAAYIHGHVMEEACNADVGNIERDVASADAGAEQFTAGDVVAIKRSKGGTRPGRAIVADTCDPGSKYHGRTQVCMHACMHACTPLL